MKINDLAAFSLEGLGTCVLIAGIWLAYPPAGLVAGGLVAILLAQGLAGRRAK